MTYEISTGPTIEPLTLEEVKLHLRIDHEDEDTLLTSLIEAARQFVELRTGRALLSQTIKEYHADFPRRTRTNPLGAIRFIRKNVQSITSIAYIDRMQMVQTLDLTTYKVQQAVGGAILYPPYGENFPYSIGHMGNVIIEYVAGWTEPAAIPKPIIQAMLLMIGDWYENRQDSKRVLPTASTRLLEPYRTNFF